MRRTLEIFTLLVLTLACTACDAYSNARPVSLNSPRFNTVEAALARWPKAPPGGPGVHRPFFATLHAAGNRVTAPGMLEYYSPRDFRITAATEMGTILFDARFNWAGVTVLRKMDQLDSRIIENVINDLALVFNLPEDTNGLEEGTWDGQELLILNRQPGDRHKYRWIFEANTGRLAKFEVVFNPFDKLHVDFLAYTPRGWPAEMHLIHDSRSYEMTISFTTDNIVQRDQQGNEE